MEHRIESRLVTAVRGLPPDKVQQVIDFADYLRTKYTADVPQRGSPEVILQALEQIGPLQFAPGELDALLTEVQALRDNAFAQQLLPKTLLDLRGSIPATETQDFAAIRGQVIQEHTRKVVERED